MSHPHFHLCATSTTSAAARTYLMKIVRGRPTRPLIVPLVVCDFHRFKCSRERICKKSSTKNAIFLAFHFPQYFFFFLLLDSFLLLLLRFSFSHFKGENNFSFFLYFQRALKSRVELSQLSSLIYCLSLFHFMLHSSNST